MDHDRLYPQGDDEPPDRHDTHDLVGPYGPLTGDASEEAVLRLGMSVEGLHRALIRGHLTGRDFRGGHWHQMTAGQVDWSAKNKFLADIYVPKGWTLKGDHNVPLLVSHDGRLTVTAVKGDRFTGLKHENPSTERLRGPVGRRHIIDMAQGEMFPGEIATPKLRYYLLSRLHRNGGQRSIRSELSLPWEVDGKGRIRRWYARYILPEIDLTGEPKPRSRHEGTEDPRVPDEDTGT